MLMVVDASAVISVLLHEPRRSAVIGATTGAEIISPASLDWEIGNALSAMFKRRVLTLEQAEKALKDFSTLPIERKPVSLIHAVQIASECNIYAYDAYMLVLAEQSGCPLCTLDGGLKDAASRTGIKLVEVAP